MTDTACAGDAGGGRRAQSSVLGVVLLFAIVIAGTGVIVMAGSTALNDTQSQSNVERVTQEMTLFDSRAAMVALGDSEGQAIKFSGGDGSYAVYNDTGYLKITNTNYTDDTTVRTEVIFNRSLGSLVYDNGETEIAYQGGGVWRRDRNGGSTMLSPPEFHYRDATLTLPVIRINNSDAGGGSVQAVVDPVGRAQRVYPNITTANHDGTDEVGPPYDPANGVERNYTNPIRNGTVNITVKSRYYLGWAEYFNQRTTGDITIFDSNETVRLTLETIGGSIGDFDMPLEGNSLNVRGVAQGHPLDDYWITLSPEPTSQGDGSGRNYGNMHWSFYVDKPDERFELHFYSKGKCKDTGGSTYYDGDLDVSVYYYNNTGDIHEEWQNQSIDVDANPDFSIDCSDPKKPLRMDLMSEDTTLSYGDIDVSGSDNKWEHGPEIEGTSTPATTTSFDIHSADDGPHSTGDERSMEYLMNHYIGLLGPNFDLTVTDGPGNGKGSGRIDESVSYGELSYDETTASQFLTYLHVTENSVDVEIE